jgi:hypothetical protein
MRCRIKQFNTVEKNIQAPPNALTVIHLDCHVETGEVFKAKISASSLDVSPYQGRYENKKKCGNED